MPCSETHFVPILDELRDRLGPEPPPPSIARSTGRTSPASSRAPAKPSSIPPPIKLGTIKISSTSSEPPRPRFSPIPNINQNPRSNQVGGQQLTAISYQPSAISHQLSAISYQPSAIS